MSPCAVARASPQWRPVMSPNDVRVPRTSLTARRLALLASVAGIGAAVLLTGPGFGSLNLAGMTPSAHAAGAVQQPTGFADLVARVKPAVISVRVRIEPGAATTGSGGGNASPF